MTATRSKLTSFWTPEIQEWIASICCIAMLAGMLFSRAILSVSMIVMVINTLHPDSIKQAWINTKKNRFVICGVLFFLSYVVAVGWTDDKAAWLPFVQIKLPFVFLPFALLNAPLQQIRHQKFVLFGILLVLLSGMIYSLSFLIINPELYKNGGHLPSPLEGDYIRFTMTLVLSINLVLYLFYERLVSGRMVRSLLVAWCVLAIAYIHIQAAKSGIVSFYLLILVYIAYEFIRRKKWGVIIGAFVMGGIAMVLLLALPSVKKQVSNLAYEKKVWEANDTTGFKKSSSVVPRLISYKIAVELIAANPVVGVGPGDMVDEIDEKYNKDYPSLRGASRILPHNQFICTMLIVGVPLSLILFLMVIAPLSRKELRVYTLSTFVIMVFGLMIEPMLEVQYGIFTYLLFTLIWMSVFKKTKAPAISSH